MFIIPHLFSHFSGNYNCSHSRFCAGRSGCGKLVLSVRPVIYRSLTASCKYPQGTVKVHTLYTKFKFFSDMIISYFVIVFFFKLNFIWDSHFVLCTLHYILLYAHCITFYHMHFWLMRSIFFYIENRMWIVMKSI